MSQHTNQTREKEQKTTVFWLETRQNTAETQLKEEDRKEEESYQFKRAERLFFDIIKTMIPKKFRAEKKQIEETIKRGFKHLRKEFLFKGFKKQSRKGRLFCGYFKKDRKNLGWKTQDKKTSNVSNRVPSVKN
jgi:hypothetical protein